MHGYMLALLCCPSYSQGRAAAVGAGADLRLIVDSHNFQLLTLYAYRG